MTLKRLAGRIGQHHGLRGALQEIHVCSQASATVGAAISTP